MAQFEEPLQVIKVIHMSNWRFDATKRLFHYSTCLAEVEAKQSQLAKLRAQMVPEASQAYAAEMFPSPDKASQVGHDDFAGITACVESGSSSAKGGRHASNGP
jgi:hypothetical protein